MSTLHLLSRVPAEQDLDRVGPGDSLLLIGEAVLAALRQDRIAGTEAFVLQADLESRGLEKMPLAPGVRRVDYGDFVRLVATHPVIQSWI